MKKAKKREYIANLDGERKAKYKKGKNVDLIGQITAYIIFAIFFALLNRLIALIPHPEGAVLNILSVVVIFVCHIIGLMLSALIAVISFILIMKLLPEEYVKINNEILKIVSDELRSFYLFREDDCLVTKCYESSDIRFNKKDIVLFKVEDEIRLTVNMKHNFSDPKNDLGCYIFTKDEITVDKMVQSAEISCEGISFLLGKRAIEYIGE